MNLRGIQKTFVRAPQQIKHKLHIGEQTKDPVYMDAELRFAELESSTKKLHEESKKYFNAINSMLNHQIEFSKAMTEIYRPISGRLSDPSSMEIEVHHEGIRACEEYEAIVKDLQETLAPELQMIENRVIGPANDLLDVIKIIRKTAVKRSHKQLDYDRHSVALKKLQEKKERSAKEEKSLFKVEGELEVAAQEYNYYNDLLKEELPRLFELEAAFIQPLFQSFYYMQLNVFYTLHEKMQQCDIGYFDLTLDVEEAFHNKRGNVQELVEQLAIVRFKTTGWPRPPRPLKPVPKPLTAGPSSTAGRIEYKPMSPSGSPNTTISNGGPSQTQPQEQITYPHQQLQQRPRVPSLSKPQSLYQPPSVSQLSPGFPQHSPSFPQQSPSFPQQSLRYSQPPPYTPQPLNSSQGNVSQAQQALAAAAQAKPKPPPPPKPKRLSSVTAAVETVTALYEYTAQAEGDLSFKAGDLIEIVQRTNNENEWWTGKLHGKSGQFPGNYVKLN